MSPHSRSRIRPLFFLTMMLWGICAQSTKGQLFDNIMKEMRGLCIFTTKSQGSFEDEIVTLFENLNFSH